MATQMLTRRLIVCLDVADGRVVKGTQFRDLRTVGDPVELAARYGEEGADEIVFLDIAASVEGRGTTLEIVRQTAERLFIPLTVGGGVRSVDDVEAALRAGADKVGINSAAVARPALLTEAAERYGAQCVVASIDARRVSADAGESPLRWEVVVRGGRTPTALDAVTWAQECADRGAGELLVTSIDADGTRAGYDLELTRTIARAVTVPVVASGGAGSAADVCAVLKEGEADAALVAGLLHDGVTTVDALKDAMLAAGVRARRSLASSVQP
jgi:cyclase